MIVYYSFTGCNQKLATKLQTKTGFDIFQINELKKRKKISILLDVLFKRKTKVQSVDIYLKQYDLIILVSPIWIERISTPMKAFLLQNKDNIKNYAFISFCGGTDNPDHNQNQMVLDELKAYIGHEPVYSTQLCISDMPEDIKNRLLSFSPVTVLDSDIAYFEDKINAFLDNLH